MTTVLESLRKSPSFQSVDVREFKGQICNSHNDHLFTCTTPKNYVRTPHVYYNTVICMYMCIHTQHIYVRIILLQYMRVHCTYYTECISYTVQFLYTYKPNVSGITVVSNNCLTVVSIVVPSITKTNMYIHVGTYMCTCIYTCMCMYTGLFHAYYIMKKPAYTYVHIYIPVRTHIIVFTVHVYTLYMYDDVCIMERGIIATCRPKN